VKTAARLERKSFFCCRKSEGKKDWEWKTEIAALIFSKSKILISIGKIKNARHKDRHLFYKKAKLFH